ncbi:hypothetical protein MUK42_28874 [Musa troglodytarum]|uniref:Uncharacterized protein n=1 Tax=Musa troglodytarum TaxID=320322 RepID=A0A9E7FHR3_9LILI|nr:hypothetical protein MUK42_28874 [Musa troglodytarum]
MESAWKTTRLLFDTNGKRTVFFTRTCGMRGIKEGDKKLEDSFKAIDEKEEERFAELWNTRTTTLTCMRAVDLLGLGCSVAAGHGSAGDVGGRGAGLRLGVEHEVADGGDDQETADGHGGGVVR